MTDGNRFSFLAHLSYELMPWRSICPSTFNILNFFSRTAEGIYSKLVTNVPYKVPIKCCYFSSPSKIQYGHPGLWLADTFWTSSQERLKGSTPNLPQMCLMRSQPSVVTSQVDPKSDMAALASDWPTHFELLLKNCWRDLLQTCYKCSLWGPDQVLLLLKSIWNPIWPLWSLIVWHFWTSSQERLKGSTPNLPQMFLMRSQPSVVTSQVDPKSDMAALASDWLTHFELLLKNGWRDLLQTCHKCSFWGPD